MVLRCLSSAPFSNSVLHNQFSFIFVPKNATKLFVNQYQFSVDEHNNCYIFCRTLDKIDKSLLTRKGCVIFQGRNQSSNYQVICPILVQGYFLDDLRPRNFLRKIEAVVVKAAHPLLRESQPIPLRINTMKHSVTLLIIVKHDIQKISRGKKILYSTKNSTVVHTK